MDREVRGQAWAGWEVREDRRAHGVRCIRRGLRRVAQEDQDSGRGWERVRDSGRGQDLGNGREWVGRLRCRRRVKRRGRSVQDREGADVRVTRRAKKVR